MNRWGSGRWLAALLMAALASPALADDYAAGEDAWRRGEHGAALAQWLPLAEDGHARAQFAVGLAYERGQGVKQSAATAARWYRRAAAQGLADAEYNLALLYLDGRGVERDLAETVSLFSAAAERGHLPAQVNLAYSYEQGSGVEQDRAVAAAWYARAAMAGNREAWSRFTELREAGIRPAVLPALPAEVGEPGGMASEQGVEQGSEQGPVPIGRAGAETDASASSSPPADNGSAPEPVAAASAVVVAEGSLQGLPRLRLAAYREAANAERGWRTLLARHEDVLGGLRHELMPVELGERGSFLRLEAGPFASLAEARAACAAIRAGGDDCLAIAPGGPPPTGPGKGR
ncbi:tetratricopeptide repeat protein [Pseudohaliea rubra]|uniref:SPOR domain-containing protein n=1 Tax=Pseudohaliea rubra DSM 19751 TaxID=1265313 RepID=A0A095XXA6_9GAMM|nr:tetratricopeptide repeat protein [Pseudohaliea rubra]KGE04341.1 hypothetical protein HRUBRA_01027 [Pseudohaliea rubra DSM 19751]